MNRIPGNAMRIRDLEQSATGVGRMPAETDSIGPISAREVSPCA